MQQHERLKSLNVYTHRPMIHPTTGQAVIVNASGEFEPVANATLPYQAWLDIDKTVMGVMYERLVVVGRLMARGLTKPLGSIGVMMALWQRRSAFTAAQVSMELVVESEKDRLTFDTVQVPVPVFHKDWEIGARQQASSDLAGAPLDVQSSAEAAQVVAESMEDVLLSGSTVQVEGSTGVIKGLNNHADRNTVTLSLAWDDASKTGAQIVADVAAVLVKLRQDGFHGPYEMFIPGAYQGALEKDYETTTAKGRTVRERLMQFEGMEGIYVADRQTANTVTTVCMRSDVVQWAMAQDTTTVQWEEKGGFVNKFKTYHVGTPLVKSTKTSQSGVCVLS